MDPSLTFARFAADLRFEDLPAEVVITLKRMVYDTIGTALAGTTLGSGCRELIDVLISMGGTPQSTVLGTDHKLPAAAAALANGATAHALNYEDVFPGGGHLAAVTFPAALAVAEQRGTVTGKEFLTAIAAGAEVMARLQQAIRAADDGTNEAKPQPTQLMGAFSAAASAARVLRLDADQTWSAIGLALMQANGSRQPVLQGTPSKALYAAFPNQAGVFSALLAERGVRGQCDAFEGEAGLFPTAYRNAYDRSVLEDRLGDEYLTNRVGFKPWPTTNRAHAFIEAAQRIAAAHAIKPHEIEQVVVSGGAHIRTFCEPLEMRRRPTGWVQAEDSIPFTVAKALVNGSVVLADFTDAGLSQSEAIQVAARVEYRIQPDLGAAARVEVRMRDGSQLAERVDRPLGHPDKPMSDAALRHKFFDCGQHAARRVPRENLERVLQIVDDLESLDDVSTIANLVSPGARSVYA